MEAYFKLEDLVKEMLLKSTKKEDIERWQNILELNKLNGRYIKVN